MGEAPELNADAETRRLGDAENPATSPCPRVPVSPRRSLVSKLRRMLRGEVSVRTAGLEAARRFKRMSVRRHERAALKDLNDRGARLCDEFARLPPAELLAHFRQRHRPEFFPGFTDLEATIARENQHPERAETIVRQARKICREHSWSILGLGERSFGTPEINWHRDPLSGVEWPLAFHADINLSRNDGSDVRVVWELNRLGHLIALGRAYALNRDEEFAAEFFRQLETWRASNPVGLGVNWNCAMEVALRAMNLLAAFSLFRHAPQMNETALAGLLRMFDQHGAHIQRNLEFSHIATSNHYLADVTGLLWLGVMLPELEAAVEWREFGFRELRREMKKQLLDDGADYEAATGYHRLKTELFLYSFLLCHRNQLSVEQEYWDKLRGMIAYVDAYLRPDGRAPLIGDFDSGQTLPIRKRDGDDHSYLAALGAAVFHEGLFKNAAEAAPDELIWLLGEQGLREYEALHAAATRGSEAFPDAGTYVLRDQDLYLLFNASGNGVNGRGSHGHNDALSVEVSACGVPFIIDPGTYVYTADLEERHRFRSTAWHSTVQVDDAEQNTTVKEVPFVMGDEAHPRVLQWESGPMTDVITAEHHGYARLSPAVTHQREVKFYKKERLWTIEDRLLGGGTHEFSFRFHLAPRLLSSVRSDGIVEVCDKIGGARLLIIPSGFNVQATLEEAFSSRDYGAREQSVIACWNVLAELTKQDPFTVRFSLLPLRAGEDVTISTRLVALSKGSGQDDAG